MNLGHCMCAGCHYHKKNDLSHYRYFLFSFENLDSLISPVPFTGQWGGGSEERGSLSPLSRYANKFAFYDTASLQMNIFHFSPCALYSPLETNCCTCPLWQTVFAQTLNTQKHLRGRGCEKIDFIEFEYKVCLQCAYGRLVCERERSPTNGRPDLKLPAHIVIIFHIQIGRSTIGLWRMAVHEGSLGAVVIDYTR